MKQVSLKTNTMPHYYTIVAIVLRYITKSKTIVKTSCKCRTVKLLKTNTIQFITTKTLHCVCFGVVVHNLISRESENTHSVNMRHCNSQFSLKTITTTLLHYVCSIWLLI